MTAQTPSARDHAMVQLVLEVLPVWMRHLASSRGQSEAAVSQMLAAFGELAPCFSPATGNVTAPAACADAVERMFQGFQYEDRVAQMMALLQQDMDRMQTTLAAADTSMDAGQWMARLESGYVMDEQRQQHHAHSHAKSAADGDETTFF